MTSREPATLGLKDQQRSAHTPGEGTGPALCLSAETGTAVLVLLVASVVINYIDRGSLSTAAPLLGSEIALSPGQLGVLLSGFFWTYSTLQVAAGWLVDRYDVKWVMAGGFLLWTLATAGTGWVGSFGALLVMRLALGIGESVAFPCYSKIIARGFPEERRGLANSLIDAGGKFGPAFGILAGGILMESYGWRPVFVVLGIGGLLWLPAWFRWVPRARTGDPLPGEDAGPGFRAILGRRQAWATFLGHFAGNYLWYFLLTWLPFYLVTERGYSMRSMALVGALAYCITAITTIITGWCADRAIARGATPTRVRKFCVVTGLGLASTVVVVVLLPGTIASGVCLMFACLAYGVFASSHWSISQTVSGPAAAGKWTGLQNCVANMAGVVAPALTGFAVEATGSFFIAFAVCAAVVLGGAAIYAFMLGRVVPLPWRDVR